MTAMTGIDVIDADGHLLESGPELERFGWQGPTGLRSVDGLLARDEATLLLAACPGARPFSADTRLEDMARERIAVSVNYPTALLMLNQLTADPDATNTLARAYNSWAYEAFTAATGGRVLTMAAVNIADPAAAVAEARRAVTDLGAPGIVVPPYAGDVHLDDPSLDPLWALADELGVAIGVHGGRGTTDPVLPMAGFRDSKRYYAMAHPFGQMVAMGDLVIGGVLHRFPRLRVAFLESGIGWVRWYVDRLDEAAESVDNNGVAWGDLDRPPSSYILGGNCYFSCEPDEPGLEELVRSVGADLVVYSSDYPHFDCAFPHTTDTLTDHVRDPDLVRKVTADNPRRLYHLT